VIGTQAESALPPGPNGELQQMYALNLAGVPPGDYLIVLQVRDEAAGQTLEVYDPFQIGRAPGAGGASR